MFTGRPKLRGMAMELSSQSAKRLFKQPGTFALAVIKQFRANQGVLLAGAVAWSVVSYFLRYFSSTSTEQISPIPPDLSPVSIRLALLFLLIYVSPLPWAVPVAATVRACCFG